MGWPEVNEEGLDTAFGVVFGEIIPSDVNDWRELLRRSINAALPYVVFEPMGDNHHNAKACPYCSPTNSDLVDLEKMLAFCRQELGREIKPWQERVIRAMLE
jgi:hypothetical protein